MLPCAYFFSRKIETSQFFLFISSCKLSSPLKLHRLENERKGREVGQQVVFLVFPPIEFHKGSRTLRQSVIAFSLKKTWLPLTLRGLTRAECEFKAPQPHRKSHDGCRASQLSTACALWIPRSQSIRRQYQPPCSSCAHTEKSQSAFLQLVCCQRSAANVIPK